MKKARFVRILAVMLIAALLVGTMSGCASLKVNKVISNFEKGCKELDSNAILDCLNPKVATPIRNAMNIFGVSDLDGVLETLAAFLAFIDFKDAEPEAVLETLEIKCKDYTYNDAKNECTVSAVITYEVEEEKKETPVFIGCELIDDTWYIMSIK